MGDRQIVLLPIETPVGKYCWQGENPCEYFDNQGGHGTCTIPGMFVRDESKNSYYVLKDEKCLNAHTAENHMSEVFTDTFGCWVPTRIDRRSASLACDGNISIELLRLCDAVMAKAAAMDSNELARFAK